jgi:hypothetical protein
MQDGQVGIGLHRIADQVLAPRECLGKLAVTVLECPPRIYIARRAEALRDVGQRYFIDTQLTLAGMEIVVHGHFPAAGWVGAGKYNGPLWPQPCSNRANSNIMPAAATDLRIFILSLGIGWRII